MDEINNVIVKNFLITVFLTLTHINSFSQVLSMEEKKLFDLIMDYRREKGLPAIQISKSLTYVAQSHVVDLFDNNPNKGNCNTHSWSSNGTWSECCYTPDHAQADCMWSKPRELTSYSGNGYEIAFYTSGEATAIDALNTWKSSSGHNEVIINVGKWDDYNWNSIGIGIHKGYAVVWFGHEFDSN